jgi:putative endonuclease
MDKEWFFYILRCRDNTLYSGITLDIPGRLKAHNSGKGAKYTAGRRPVILVYQEKCLNISHARKREVEIKSWPKSQKELFIVKNPPSRFTNTASTI